jgi:hypothetical protein
VEKIPIFQRLPRTAPINNHRKNGMSRQDKAAGKEDLLQLMLQYIQLTMEYAQKTED